MPDRVANRLIQLVTDSAQREILVAGLLAFALFFVGTAATPILGRDEGRFSQASREMLDRGDLIVPTFVGEGRYHKPILIYWCTMASYAVFGVNERAARLPANIAGAMAVMLLAWSSRRRFGAGAGLLAGLLLAVTLVFHVEARGCTADMVLFVPTLAVMLAFERILAADDGWGAPFVFWTAMGVAILAKGPIAPMWVLLTGIGLWALARRWRVWHAAGMVALFGLGLWFLGPAALVPPALIAGWDLVRATDGRSVLRRFRFGWGLPLLLAITLPWAVAATVATGGAFLREAIGEHVLSRSFSAFESHGFFPGFYVVTAVIVAFPWFAWIFDGLRRGGRVLAGSELRFLAAWLLGPLVLLELVQTKLVHYWMPSYPAGILLVVGWAVAGDRIESSGRGLMRALLLLGGLAVAAAPVGLALHLDVPSLTIPALAAAIVLVGGVGAALVCDGGGRRVGALVWVISGTAGFLVLLFGMYLPRLGAESIGPRSGRRASELLRPGETVVVFKPRDDEIFFYLPLGSEACGGAGCMDRRFEVGSDILALARVEDFDQLVTEWPGVVFDEAERVGGIDLGHVQRDEVVLFRIYREIPADIDRHRPPS